MFWDSGHKADQEKIWSSPLHHTNKKIYPIHCWKQLLQIGPGKYKMNLLTRKREMKWASKIDSNCYSHVWWAKMAKCTRVLMSAILQLVLPGSSVVPCFWTKWKSSMKAAHVGNCCNTKANGPLKSYKRKSGLLMSGISTSKLLDCSSTVLWYWSQQKQKTIIK